MRIAPAEIFLGRRLFYLTFLNEHSYGRAGELSRSNTSKNNCFGILVSPKTAKSSIRQGAADAMTAARAIAANIEILPVAIGPIQADWIRVRDKAAMRRAPYPNGGGYKGGVDSE